MPVTFDPPDFIEQAAAAEQWNVSDWRHWEAMKTSEFDDALQVKRIERTSVGLDAHGAPFADCVQVLFTDGAEKPTLTALEALSLKLLGAKEGRTST